VRGIPQRIVNKQAGPEKAGAAAPAQQPGLAKLIKVVVGGKLCRRGETAHFPHEL
jgi:hypothetical protein